VVVLTVGVLAWVSVINYQTYFDDYEEVYLRTAHNVTEVGGAIHEFADGGPGIESAFIKIWPYWLDTRNLALTLGDLRWDNVLTDIERASGHLGTSDPKLYILHPEDTESLDWLRRAYPAGVTEEYQSAVGKNFVMFFTAPGTS
jgi:hypothetical protein